MAMLNQTLVQHSHFFICWIISEATRHNITTKSLKQPVIKKNNPIFVNTMPIVNIYKMGMHIVKPTLKKYKPIMKIY
jgi:hypothetical protein